MLFTVEKGIHQSSSRLRQSPTKGWHGQGS